jgi:ADP-heptose:LPS heptosyltransferase
MSLSSLPRKILMIKIRPLGPTVLMTAALEELKKAYPTSRIDVVAISEWAAILENNPAVNKIWSYDRHPERMARAKSTARLGFRLRKENYDWVINLHASPSSSTLALATGARTRAVHFYSERDKDRYSTVKITGKGEVKSVIEKDLDTLRSVGIKPAKKPSSKVYLSDAELASGLEYLQRFDSQRPILGLAIGASRGTKIWPIENFVKLALSWCQDTDGSVYAISGSKQEAILVEFLRKVDEELVAGDLSSEDRKKIRSKIGFFDSPPLRHSAAILAHSDLLVANNTGLRHLAVAMGIPTLTLFGPESPTEWHPYPKSTHPYFFLEELNCRTAALPGTPPWCDIPECVVEAHKCLRSINVKPVLTKAKALLSKGDENEGKN